MANYLLMHKDIELGKLEIESVSGSINKIVLGSNTDFLPPRAARSDYDFIAWWNDRAIPKTRVSLHSFLEDRGVHSTGKYLLDNLALSMTDCYWVRPENSRIAWKDVNFFDNDFLAPSQISVRQHSSQITSYSFSPDASTGGDLPKWWISDNGVKYLLKGSSGGSVQQSFNEVLATKIHSMQNCDNYVDYSICKLPDGSIGCRSKAFTSGKIEFISAWELVGRYDYKRDEPFRDNFISACINGGLKRDDILGFLDYQTITDFLISNTDRHLNNFGIIRDSDTLEFLSLAPIFDSGNSMMYKRPWEADMPNALNEKLRGFYSDSKRAMGHVETLSLVSVDRLPKRGDVEQLYSAAPLIGHEAGKLARLFEGKADFLSQLQRGRSYYDLYKAYCNTRGRILGR